MNAFFRFARRPAMVLCLMSVLAPFAGAQSIVFSNFSSTTGLTLTSSATTGSGASTAVRLVSATTNDAGAVFTTAARSITSFSTSFQFKLSNVGGGSDGTGSQGADGLVFVVQRTGNNALGSAGEGLGFQGIGANSFGVEFDTWKNTNLSDPTSNHVGINLAGSVTSASTANVGTNFDDGNVWTAWIDYDGSTLEVRANQTGLRGAALLTYSSLNLATLINGSSAYIGFTAATGSSFAHHDVLKWTFSDTYIAGGVTAGLTPVPEPGTYAAIVGALALAVAAWRRARSSRGNEAGAIATDSAS